MKYLRVGIDNYGLFPLTLSPLQILHWARDNGAEGVQFSGLTPEESERIHSKNSFGISAFICHKKITERDSLLS